VLILRYLTGTTERSWADFNDGFKTNLSGTLFYQAEEYFKPTPVSNPILDASITQDDVGHIVINGGGFAPRARLDVVQTSNLPVLIADQQRTDGGDLFQAKYKATDKFVVKQSGDIMVAGVVYDSNYQAVWLPGNVVEWKTALDPIYVAPLGMALSLTSNTAKYRFVGHEVAYQFSTVVTLTGTPSDVVAYPDMTITLAPYFSPSAYPDDTIVGDVWITATFGGNATMYKGFARTITESIGQSVTIRYLNSIYDRPFADFVSGTVLDIRGSLLYQSSSTSYLTVPQTYTPARMKQDVDGRIIVSQIEEAPLGRFHIKESSSEPAMIVEQMGTGTGDAFQFRSNAVPKFVVNRSGNIGVGTTQATFPIDINGDMRITGSVYNQANEVIWIDGTTVQWKQAIAPAYVFPAGVTFQYATSNATFRYIGNEIIYNFLVSGTVKSAPSVAGADYKLALQYPVLQSAYPTDAIVGDLWFNVTSNVSSTTYKAYARTMSQPSSNSQMTTRFLNGAMDMPLSAIAVNSTTTLQGTIVYQTPNPAFGFPVPFKTFKGVIQDQDENIIVNGVGEATLGRFTVVQTSNQPAFIVNNKTPKVNGNDTVQFKQNDTVVMRLTSEGHLLPGACNTYDLGSSNYRFKDLYLSGNTLDIGGTQIKRMEDTGALMITDDSGDAQSGYFKHVYVDGTIQGSNLKILGDFVTLDTITSNTEQMVITNAGTGPALKVTQTGANSIAEFYDDGNVLALKIADGGNVGIGTGIPMGKLHIVDSTGLGSKNNQPLLYLHNPQGNLQSSAFKIYDKDNDDPNAVDAGSAFTVDMSANQGLVNLVGGAECISGAYYYTSTRGASRINLADGAMNFYMSTLANLGGQLKGSAVTWTTPLSLTSTGATFTSSKIDIHQVGTGGGQNRFTGIEDPTSANGRAQLVLSSAYSDVVIASSQANSSYGSTLTFAAYDPANSVDYRKFVIQQRGWGGAQFMDFGYTNTATTNPHTVVGSGRLLTLDGGNQFVGIGTSSPATKLHVEGNMAVRNGNILLGNTDVTQSSTQGLYWNTSTDTNYAIHRTTGGWSSPDFQQLRISWVTGIIMAPGSAYGKSFVDIQGYQKVAQGDNSITYYGPNSTWSSYLAVGAGTSKVNASTAQCISTNGNLHLDCGSGKSTYINFYSGVSTVFKPGGGSFTDSSDMRLKTDIENIPNALMKLLQLRGVQYKWIHPEHHQEKRDTQYGFLAQEYESFSPQSISNIGIASGEEQALCPDGIKALNVNFDFHAYTLEAIRELHLKQMELQNQNDALLERIRVLESRYETSVQ